MLYHIQNYTLNQRGADTIHAVSVTKYQKHPSTSIPKYVILLAEVIKSHDVRLYNITMYNKCTVLNASYTQ